MMFASAVIGLGLMSPAQASISVDTAHSYYDSVVTSHNAPQIPLLNLPITQSLSPLSVENLYGPLSMRWAQSSTSVLGSYALSAGASPDTGMAEVDSHVYFSVNDSGQYTISGVGVATQGRAVGFMNDQLYDKSINPRRALLSIASTFAGMSSDNQLPSGIVTLEAGHEYLWVSTAQLYCSAGATPSTVTGSLELVDPAPAPGSQDVPEPAGLVIHGGLAGVFLVCYLWHRRRRRFSPF